MGQIHCLHGLHLTAEGVFLPRQGRTARGLICQVQISPDQGSNRRVGAILGASGCNFRGLSVTRHNEEWRREAFS